jgi:hypothetical protein
VHIAGSREWHVWYITILIAPIFFGPTLSSLLHRASAHASPRIIVLGFQDRLRTAKATGLDPSCHNVTRTVYPIHSSSPVGQHRSHMRCHSTVRSPPPRSVPEPRFGHAPPARRAGWHRLRAVDATRFHLRLLTPSHTLLPVAPSWSKPPLAQDPSPDAALGRCPLVICIDRRHNSKGVDRLSCCHHAGSIRSFSHESAPRRLLVLLLLVDGRRVSSTLHAATYRNRA